MQKPLLLALTTATVLLLLGCSPAAESSAPPPPSSAAESLGMSTAEACAQVAETYQREKARLETRQAAERNLMDSAKTNKEKRVAWAEAGRGLEEYEANVAKVFSSLWPQVDDPDLKDILKGLARNIYDDPNVAALNGMCA